MTRRCRICEGEGIVEDYYCQLCQQRIADDDTWWQADDDMLPCGHSEAYLVETTTCPDCGGDGLVEQWLSPAEVAAIRRGKIARFIYVAGALVVLIAVLTVVALRSDNNESVCGYWWYGVPALLLVVKHLPVH